MENRVAEKECAASCLRKGCRGEQVEKLQRALEALGYAPGGADGIFGPKTLAAVLRFQRAAGLDADGIAGPLTHAALLSALNAAHLKPEQKDREADASALRARFLAYLGAMKRHIYVWGGNGQLVTPALIRRMETSERNIRRAIALYETRVGQGMQAIRCFDCSGLISRFFQEEGLVEKKRNCRHLLKLCEPVERAALQPGDLVFRCRGTYPYHVGAYIGAGLVIESKGRDDGVVERGIDDSGSGYWNRCGRLKLLWENAPAASTTV